MLLTAKVINQNAFRNLRIRREQPGQRLTAATAYPFYSLENAKLERGISCKGCQVRLELLRGDSHWLARDRIFSTQGFLSHFTVVSKHSISGWRAKRERGLALTVFPDDNLECVLHR